MKATEIKKLKKISTLSRIYSLISIFFAGSGHPGGVLSSIDVITYLFQNKLKFKNVKDYKINHRNRFILSKGHSVPALYSVLAALNSSLPELIAELFEKTKSHDESKLIICKFPDESFSQRI